MPWKLSEVVTLNSAGARSVMDVKHESCSNLQCALDKKNLNKTLLDYEHSDSDYRKLRQYGTNTKVSYSSGKWG